jgi:hypothetical protein
MSTADDDAPMSEGLVRMILRTAGFNSPEEVREAAQKIIEVPEILSPEEVDRVWKQTKKEENKNES